MKKSILLITALAMSFISWSQFIYEPEGMNMPGSWNSWNNVPTNLALANSNQAVGGRIVRIATGTPRWQTNFSVASSGGDLVGGNYDFKFSAGPTSNYWNNVWGGTNVTLNTLQTHFIGAGNSNVTLTNGKWYTVNFVDNNYTNTQAIFMETGAQPVSFSSVAQSPLNGSVTNSDNVVVTVNASASPSAGEIVYVRWSNNGFSTSSLALVTFVGSVGTATIPAQSAATQVDYYVFSTSVSGPAAADVDKVTIKFKNAGPGNYTYTVNPLVPPVTITFQVDMSQQVVGGAVNIAGTFTGWAPVAMTSIGAGVYKYDAILNQGSSHQYKFLNGASYEGSIGAPCGNGSDRTYTVGVLDATLSTVCFGSCSSCPPTDNVTFRVNMSNESVGGSVYINGSFPPAYWTTPQLMTSAGGGVYTYNVSLPQGASYEYKFINGASYESNLSSPCGNGSNRTITVPASASTILPLTCFSYCADCVILHAVTFNVNMADQNVSANGVHLAGSFGSIGYPDWDPMGILMTDANNDGIYNVTLNLQQGQSYQFKYVNGNAWGTDESLSGACQSGGNRSVNVSTSNVNLAPVCFASCSNCTYAVANDSPNNAVTVSYSSNMNYPNCYAINGTTLGASNSPQSQSYTGNDTWYKFTAQSTAVSITLNSPTQDDAIELYSRSGGSFVLMAGGIENVSSGASDFERLNYSGLTIGQTYYVSVGAFDASTIGAFTLCIQHLMPSGCASVQPVGGFPLCSSYKAIARGSAASGVSYGFSFTGVGGGASGTTSISGTNGLTTLNNASLGLRYGGIYDVQVNAVYALLNSAGTTESITINGSTSSANCSAVAISAQPNLEVKSSQRCNAVLSRSTYLIGTNVVGDALLCGAISYTYKFTQVVSCSDGTASGLPIEYTTAGASPYLALGVLPNLPNTGAWDVQICPNFGYGNGTYGPTQRISVNNTASAMLSETSAMDNAEKSMSEISDMALYPNPNNGTMVNLNISDIKSDNVFVRILDSMGRIAYSNRYTVDGSLNTIVNFSEPLASGLYMVEFTIDGEVRTERMMVQK